MTKTPIVGVIPPIKPGAAASASKVMGLLATPGTVARPYVDELHKEFAGDCRLIRVGSTHLVRLAEEKLQGRHPDPNIIRSEIAPLFWEPELDTVLLGCTHFPHLKEEFLSIAPRSVTWLDTGEAIARRVKGILLKEKPKNYDPMENIVIFSKQPPANEELIHAFRKRNLHVFQKLKI